MNRKKLSELRRRFDQLLKERSACEAAALGREEMAPASFLERQMPPSGHTGYYLAANIDGRPRHRYVRKVEAEWWRKRCERWSEFYWSLSRWRKLNKEIDQVMREMGQERSVPLPAKKKVPPKRRKTRASKVND